MGESFCFSVEHGFVSLHKQAEHSQNVYQVLCNYQMKCFDGGRMRECIRGQKLLEITSSEILTQIRWQNNTSCVSSVYLYSVCQRCTDS